MKFKADLKDIVDVVNKINKVLNPKDEIGKTFLIGADEDKQKILISATNSDGLIAYAYVSAEVIKEGEAIIEGKLLYNLVRKLPKKSPELLFYTTGKRKSDKSLKLKVSKKIYEFDVFDIDFPTPKTRFQWSFDVDMIDFKLLLESAGWLFGSKMEENTACEGVSFEFKDNTFEVISTDLVKAAFCKVEYDDIEFDKTKIVIPSKVIKLISEQLKNYEEVEIFISDEFIKIKLDNINFISVLIPDKYPDPRKLYNPKKKGHSALFDRLELKKSLDRLILFTDKIRQLVTWDLKLDKPIILTSNNITNKKRSVEELEEYWGGKPLFIGLNCEKLLQICKKSKSKELRLTFRQPEDAVVVQEPDNDNTFYLLTSLRVD